MTTETFIFIAASIGILSAIALVILFSSIIAEARKLRKTLHAGVEQTKAGVELSAQGLRDTVMDARTVMTDFPSVLTKTVSAELRTALEPLQEQMASTFDQTQARLSESSDLLKNSMMEVCGSQNLLQRTLATINQDGHLGEWVEALRSAAVPLQESVAIIEHNHKIAQELVMAHTQFGERFAGHWEHIEKCFIGFKNLVATENARDASLIASMEHRVLNRLEEVAGIHAKVAEHLSELQTALATLSASNITLTQQSARSLADVGTIVKTTEVVSKHLETEMLRHQKFFQEFNEWQATIQKEMESCASNLTQMGNTANRILNGLADRIDEAQSKTEGLVDSAASAIMAAAKRLVAGGEKLTQSVDAAMDRQSAAINAQMQSIEKIGMSQRALPSRGLQWTEITLLILIAILLGASLAMCLK